MRAVGVDAGADAIVGRGNGARAQRDVLGDRHEAEALSTLLGGTQHL